MTFKIARAEIEATPDSEKHGCHKHISKLMNVIEIFGGFDRQAKGALVDQIYERYESDEEVARIVEASRGVTKKGNPKKFRLWADIRLDKLRTGDASATPCEAERIWVEAKKALGHEFADLFSPKQLVQTHPSVVIETALTENIPFGRALDNPILLLRLLAEVAVTEPPTITILDPDAPKLTDQGDGRSEGFEILDPLPVIHVDQRFCLDIRTNRTDDHKVVVFEYANSEIARIGDNQPKLAIPMRFQVPKPHGVWMMKSDNSPLVARPTIGQFGFCALTVPFDIE